MGQATKLLIFTANEFFEFNNTKVNFDDFTYDGETVYDHSRKGYSRVLPINKNTFRLIDYLENKFWLVCRKDKNTIEYLDEEIVEPKTFTFV